MPETLLVRARGLAIIENHEAAEAGARKFVGRVHDPKLGKNGGWPPDEAPHTVPDRAEYRAAIKHGDLWAADEETAKKCAVDFDPTFGKEPEVAPPVDDKKTKAKSKVDDEVINHG